MATSLAGLSASVTRILYLTGFPKELKTKDIQSAFSDYESINGGFKIKWRDDTSLLIVFQDPSVAKRAYLNTIASPPAILTSSTGAAATIRPYDGPDAQSIIQTVNSRGQHTSNPSRSHNARSASVSVFPTTRTISGSSSSVPPNRTSQHVAIPEHQHPNGREPSPTLPSLPSHPTLNYLINSSLGEAVAGSHSSPPSDPAILATSLHPDLNGIGGPRIGDPGKRMLGAALGVRHPSLGPRVLTSGGGGSSPGTSPTQGGGVDQAMREVQKAMGGLVVAE
ncbi:hypothetical protein D9615_001174 [Tricholomella constricta]|uniref:Uncharacterized protein n=1 Tax=Tricholomella constricta TaxID=117010 RepID=A0A8H5HKP4_9AGAR|nr:hypothetical protein D9615_001174 [Tricholomella constricta]